MPPKKKKSKAKGKKAAGKGGANKAADNAMIDEEQKKGTVNSEMQRLRIGEQKGDEDDVEAMLEEAIKLAAVEKQEMKVKEKENCTHGYRSSRIQARFCENHLKTFMESYHVHLKTFMESYDSTCYDSLYARCNSANAAFTSTITKSFSTTNVSRNASNAACVKPFCLAEGTKIILDGKKSDDARLCALLALITKSADAGELPDRQKMLELLDGDERTLVQFFRKQIPCSCLDEKHKEVKSVTKMGICYNEDSCPLPGNMAVRSKMLRCTGCRNVNYCSRECQEANWPVHKKFCGLTTQEIAAKMLNVHDSMLSNKL